MYKKNTIKLFLLAFLVSGFIISCTNQTKEEKKSDKPLPVFLSYIDSSESPANDFYKWAVGKWLKNNPVPSTESSWTSFNQVNENNKIILKEILEEAANSNSPKGSDKQKIGDFYKCGMDSISINKLGVQPLTPFFDQIKNINDKKQLVDIITAFQSQAIQIVFGVYADQDQTNSNAIVPYFYQGGISLPDRDYYLKNDEDSKRIRDEYVKHMTNVFQLMGDAFATARKQAETILALETKMAEISMDRLTMRNPYATYHKYSVKDFAKITPSINWLEVNSKIGLPLVDTVIVSQPDYFKGLDKLIQTEPLDIWKTYLRWAVVSNFGGALSDDFVNEFFHFNGSILQGQKENKPRWERTMLSINANLGMALGKLFVEKSFTPEAKQRVLDMVKNMQATFKTRLQNLDWMSDATKQKAIAKLDKFLIKIGYPDKWRDYSSLEIDPTQAYVINVMRANAFEYNRKLAKIGKPVDRTEWIMNPQEVNAYYNPSLNEIVFPAGILQPPFFDMNVDDAYNYGAIGAVIGHEMTHGFDDEGRQFDADGNLKNWWTSEDSTKFVAKTGAIVEQFNNYTVLDTIHVNGALTLGENIADLGGITIALDALQHSNAGKDSLYGFSAEQRYFMAWANSWKYTSTDEDRKQRIITDPHAPKDIRGFAPLTNLDAFQEAFGMKEGDKMYKPKDKRIKIW